MEGTVLRITPSERSALQLLADGKTTDEVASCLGTSEKEIEGHLATLFMRLGAANRSEAIAAADRRGLLNPGHFRRSCGTTHVALELAMFPARSAAEAVIE